jgi:hypothetical protein
LILTKAEGLSLPKQPTGALPPRASAGQTRHRR